MAFGNFTQFLPQILLCTVTAALVLELGTPRSNVRFPASSHQFILSSGQNFRGNSVKFWELWTNDISGLG